MEMPIRLPRVVVKLGGSLLERRDWPCLLTAWLKRQPRSSWLLICGGGQAVDKLRAADQAYSLGAETCHWQAIAQMGVNARAVAARFPQAVVSTCLRQANHLLQSLPFAQDELGTNAPAPGKGGIPPLVFLDCEPFLRQETTWNGVAPLPHSWDVTSDSIAARVAHRVSAQELVLLKSSLPTLKAPLAVNGNWLAMLAATGYIDPYFPKAARGLRGQFVDLTSILPAAMSWHA